MKKNFRLIILLTIVIMLVACLVACNDKEGGGIVVVPSKVVVTFDTNGGSEVPAITIDENTALTLPTPPTKEGYTFAGWYVDEATTTAFQNTNTIPSDITVYAKWTENAKYAVTFVGGEGATGTAPTMESQYAGAEITLPENTFSAVNHTFAGWYDGSTIRQPGAVYTMTASAVTFTATWTANAKYAVTFVGGASATGTAPTMESQYAGAEITLPANTFSAVNHTFAGWYDGSTIRQPGAVYTMTASDVTFTATWTANAKYAVTFVGGEGATGTAPTIESQYEGAEITLPANTLAKENNAFDGWLGGNGKLYQPGARITIGTQALTFIVAWNPTNTDVKYTLSSTGTSYVATARNTAITTADIAPSLNGLPVTTIPVEGFKGCSALTSVTIPSSVTSIGAGAFADNANLISITLPFVGAEAKTMYDADQYPFGYIFGEISLLGITGTTQHYFPSEFSLTDDIMYFIPNTLRTVVITGSTHIPNGAFTNCTAITSITLPDSVTSIGISAFDGCTSLSTIDVSPTNNVTIVGVYAFYDTAWFAAQADDLVYFGNFAYGYQGDPSAPSVELRANTTGIGSMAFADFTGLTEITIPDSVKYIGEEAFRGCNALASVIIGEDSRLELIGNAPFDFNLAAASFSGLLYLGKVAYQYCGDVSALSSISLKNDTTAIATGLFYDCSALTSIAIPDTVRVIGEGAFADCINLASVTFGENSQLEMIGSSAFNKCAALTSITIPSSVKQIGYEAFADASALNGVYITDLAAWCGIVFANETSNPLSSAQSLYINGVKATDITIPDSVEIVRDYAFFNCDSLVSVTFADSVTRVGFDAFNDCFKLMTVSFSENSKLNSLGDFSFGNCLHLMDLTLPPLLTDVGEYALDSSSKLVHITDLGNHMNTAVGASIYEAFDQEIRTSTETAFVNTLSVDSDGVVTYTVGTKVYCMGYIGDETTLDLSGKKITDIYDTAFYGYATLTSITIPSSVIHIGISAFSECTGLTSIIIPSSVTRIGADAFYSCSELTEITIPSSLTSIGSGAFSNTAWYNNQPDGLVYAGRVAYKYKGTMPANTSITLKSDTTGIVESAFINKTGLTSIFIPSSVTSIGDFAFINCTRLESITVEAGNTAYYSAGNCLIETATNKLIAGCKTSIIPSTVTIIGEKAFSLYAATSIDIPSSVTIIESYAFAASDKLDTINYNGTKAQWEAIEKGTGWSINNLHDYTIHCTDGDIIVDNN